ncbi:MAG: ATP-binding cassette domain-containing protein [Propionibacteriaceae bacterium]|nr:ATP-binding cassette domain-containing protein [Propionibacteriaceae bacterium]
MTEPILQIDGLRAAYGDHVVLTDINLEVPKGSCAAIVGESGSGKSTFAKVLMGLKRPAAGKVLVEGKDIWSGQFDRRTNGMEMIFQDPISSLNPRRSLAAIVAEPLRIRGVGDAQSRRTRSAELLDQVGLPAERYAGLRPSAISGGQAQRVAIARALAAEPRVLVCDEPVSALDVSVQATVLNLFADLRDHYGLTMLFISHDLAAVRMISDTVHVLQKGVFVESGPTDQVINEPTHEYTQQLMAAAPSL